MRDRGLRGGCSHLPILQGGTLARPSSAVFNVLLRSGLALPHLRFLPMFSWSCCLDYSVGCKCPVAHTAIRSTNSSARVHLSDQLRRKEASLGAWPRASATVSRTWAGATPEYSMKFFINATEQFRDFSFTSVSLYRWAVTCNRVGRITLGALVRCASASKGTFGTAWRKLLPDTIQTSRDTKIRYQEINEFFLRKKGSSFSQPARTKRKSTSRSSCYHVRNSSHGRPGQHL